MGGLFVAKNIPNNLEIHLLKAAESLHETISGKQNLRMLKINRLFPSKDEDFNSIRVLLKEYKDITKTDYKEFYEKTKQKID